MFRIEHSVSWTWISESECGCWGLASITFLLRSELKFWESGFLQGVSSHWLSRVREGGVARRGSPGTLRVAPLCRGRCEQLAVPWPFSPGSLVALASKVDSGHCNQETGDCVCIWENVFCACAHHMGGQCGGTALRAGFGATQTCPWTLACELAQHLHWFESQFLHLQNGNNNA